MKVGKIGQFNRIVIKVGSALLLDNNESLTVTGSIISPMKLSNYIIDVLKYSLFLLVLSLLDLLISEKEIA